MGPEVGVGAQDTWSRFLLRAQGHAPGWSCRTIPPGLAQSHCVWPRRFPAEEPGRGGMNSREPGTGWGSFQGREERPGTLCWERQRGKGRGGKKAEKSLNFHAGSQAKVNPARLLAPSHAHSFHDAGQVFQAAARGRGPPLQPGEVSPHRGGGARTVMRGCTLAGLHRASLGTGRRRASTPVTTQVTGPCGLWPLTRTVRHPGDLAPPAHGHCLLPPPPATQRTRIC